MPVFQHGTSSRLSLLSSYCLGPHSLLLPSLYWKAVLASGGSSGTRTLSLVFLFSSSLGSSLCFPFFSPICWTALTSQQEMDCLSFESPPNHKFQIVGQMEPSMELPFTFKNQESLSVAQRTVLATIISRGKIGSNVPVTLDSCASIQATKSSFSSLVPPSKNGSVR